MKTGWTEKVKSMFVKCHNTISDGFMLSIDIHLKLLTPLDFHAVVDFHRDHLSTQLPPPTQPSLTEASVYKAQFKSSV